MSTSTGLYNCSRTALPSAWETRATGSRNISAMALLKIDGLHVRYIGQGEDDSQAATVRANHPVPLDCPLYYFEVEVINRGQAGLIGVGFMKDDALLCRLPGWDAHSYGYHGDDGSLYSGSGTGRRYGPTYGVNSVVGALLNRSDRSITFYLNGVSLGVAFRDVQEERLYPCVGLRTAGEEVVALFGASNGRAFKTDVAAVNQAFREGVVTSIQQVPLPLHSSQGQALMPQLIYEYLLHHRCWQTANIIARDLLTSQPHEDAAGSSNGGMTDAAVAASSDVDAACGSSGSASGGGGSWAEQASRRAMGVCHRQAIYDAVLAGHLDQAASLLQTHFSAQVLEKSPRLDFRLRLQHLLEMLRATAETADAARQNAAAAAAADGHGGSSSMDDGCGTSASCRSGSGTSQSLLSYCREVLAPLPRSAEDEEVFIDACSLMAYDDPRTGPAGHLLHKSHRVDLAEQLNGAIVQWLGGSPCSALERVVQQAEVCIDELKRLHVARAMGVDVKQLVMKPPATASAATMTAAAAAAGSSNGAAGSSEAAVEGSGPSAMQTDSR